jgi:RNA polymerase sigma-70 factor (ECF subfamily)
VGAGLLTIPGLTMRAQAAAATPEPVGETSSPDLAPGLWSDLRLVAAAKAGAPGAFERLVARHQQAVRAFLRRACGDWTLADDLAQETFLTAWSRLAQLKGDASVRAWLCGIGYRKHLTARRSAGRERARERAWEAERPSADQPMTHERLVLEAAMQGLTPEQRACVALCLAADFSHAEAAEALSLPLGTVKSHVARGRARLLEVLGGGQP